MLAFLDHAVASVPGLDGDRVGIMGGSYGGYLTAWIIAHDHRWAGAIVERGYLDPASFVGSSDIGWRFPQQYHGTKQAMDAQSPMLLTDRVTTPTFVVHSEQDLRCPLSQALRYYTQLKQGGVDAELLVFPGENHELSRSGTPWHRRQRFEAILDWWARHLPVS
ncbi:MAG: prolyl oligopeptidase family serine peptidase [Micropruina sp.]|uniref:alpha/beta hydrolase family protein n=1 Tax=Micropruina sp. TaxID=2737536 RepID=UPI0039E55432